MKTPFLLSLLLSLVVLSASAQRKNVVKLDIHAPIMRTGILSYERVLNENASFGFSALYTDRSEGITNASYLTRFAFTPEFRYYLMTDNAPRGLYVSGSVRYQWMRAEYYEYYNDFFSSYSEARTKELSTIGAGINLGFQEIFKERIAIEVFVGPCWNSGDERPELGDIGSTRPNEVFVPYVGYFVRTGLNVGILF
jgi:hypothetical protein